MTDLEAARHAVLVRIGELLELPDYADEIAEGSATLIVLDALITAARADAEARIEALFATLNLLPNGMIYVAEGESLAFRDAAGALATAFNITIKDHPARAAGRAGLEEALRPLVTATRARREFDEESRERIERGQFDGVKAAAYIGRANEINERIDAALLHPLLTEGDSAKGTENWRITPVANIGVAGPDEGETVRDSAEAEGD